uniref:RNase H-like protein n=1 Tax=Glycine max TaxID=3847 RepID=A0A510CTP5_SOYBN|nr:RNase H-like protein [Glycine max]BBA68382.1 RNase H-like protein [Glycine max]BBA68383.1 RNase H-like protein [Glycine max]BBA68384.1 RNase H-like protein [Glycine max]BBA68385.1 RNase H-like protein [Glycine max]
MSGSNDGSGSWSSRFLKVASAAAATAAVAGGLYAILSSSTSASSEMEVPFGSARPESNTKRQQESFYEHEETEDDEESEEADNGKWKKPESGWVKLNVDGSRIHEEPASAGCGGVIRDEWGTWCVGFDQKLDPNICRQAHYTELQAILTGLKVAREDMINVEKLVVESDSEPAVNMVKSRLGYKYHRPEYKVVQDINRLLKDPKWLARLDYVPRKANRVANYLAKRVCKLSSPHDHHHFSKYPCPPDYDCKKIFLEDNN